MQIWVIAFFEVHNMIWLVCEHFVMFTKHCLLDNVQVKPLGKPPQVHLLLSQKDNSFLKSEQPVSLFRSEKVSELVFS